VDHFLFSGWPQAHKMKRAISKPVQEMMAGLNINVKAAMLALIARRLSITHNFGSDSGSQRDVGQAR
jgi:hypothetical protein